MATMIPLMSLFIVLVSLKPLVFAFHLRNVHMKTSNEMNAVAGRAVNPFTGRFMPLAYGLIFVFVLAVIWYLFLPFLISYLKMSLYGFITPSLASDFGYLFFMGFGYLVLPFFFISLAAPGGLSSNMKSLMRNL